MNIAIVLSGGVGSRMGLSIPKQYVEIDGKPIIEYCLKTILRHKMVDMAIIGVADEWLDYIQKSVNRIAPEIPVFYCKPGENRQGTIIEALKKAHEEGAGNEDVVLIHDAARPLLTSDLITSCFEGCKYSDAVLPVIPVKDTIYLSHDGKHINSLLERNCLWNGQAPEAFKFGSYYAANLELTEEALSKITGSTEVAYRAGLKCVLIPGDTNNFKITTKEDLSNFESIVRNESL